MISLFLGQGFDSVIDCIGSFPVLTIVVLEAVGRGGREVNAVDSHCIAIRIGAGTIETLNSADAAKKMLGLLSVEAILSECLCA